MLHSVSINIIRPCNIDIDVIIIIGKEGEGKLPFIRELNDSFKVGNMGILFWLFLLILDLYYSDTENFFLKFKMYFLEHYVFQ